MDQCPSHLLTNGDLDGSKIAASQSGVVPAHVSASRSNASGATPLGVPPSLLKSSWGAHIPSKIRLKSSGDDGASSVEIVVDYHGKPVHRVKGCDARLGILAVDKAMSPRQDLFTDDGHVLASVGVPCASVGGFHLATPLMPSASPLVKEVSRVGPIMMKPIHLEGKHRPVCDGEASVSVPPGMQNDEVAKESPSVDSSPSHGEPVESPGLRVSFHLPDSKDASFVKDPLHLEGQHIPICAGEVLDDVSSGMPSEAAVEDAPTVISTPSPHAVQRDLAPDDDSACRIASDVERLRKQLMEIKDQRCLDLQLPCCT
ncbi:hypothetical protein Nepgr_024037 [Nepenthes gracilis]|uniref:Uncharacterized protein n=1 Tax=Nepenthes gracilis TaxID=150966 RepID=A0AAD3T3W0_NEPGR|nr:hypothetical protein Nepgr_024037 [Nepenthes gracilis]